MSQTAAIRRGNKRFRAGKRKYCPVAFNRRARDSFLGHPIRRLDGINTSRSS